MRSLTLFLADRKLCSSFLVSAPLTICSYPNFPDFLKMQGVKTMSCPVPEGGKVETVPGHDVEAGCHILITGLYCFICWQILDHMIQGVFIELGSFCNRKSREKSNDSFGW